jgi:putative flippase GtrA
MFSRLSKYSFVAAGSAASDWLVFMALSYVSIDPIFAQATARVVGGLVSFFSNRNWSFSATKTTSKTKQIRRFMLLYCASYGLSLGLFYLLVETLQMNIFLSKIIIDSVCFLGNFVVMWLYVFNKRAGTIDWFKSIFQQSK